MILGYVDTIEQNIISFEADFHEWKTLNTIGYNAVKWSDILIQTGDTTEYAIKYDSNMVNIGAYNQNKVKDISTWDVFNEEDIING